MKGDPSVENRHLHILWTNADPTTAKLMVMMYAKYSMKNGWWDKCTVIVWGATVKLLSENQELQEEMRLLQTGYGVEFAGCVTCAKELNAVDKMTELGVKLEPWGPHLTRLIQTGAPLITV
ncbi:MAG: DsrE family protein [Oscillospiraceae bacterium]|nr:DsrE family protein [Oscillospiraceae bacterium]